MKVIEHITLVLAFFSASFYAMAENKMRSGKLMSKEELTQKYDKNDNGQLDYREKMAFIKSLNDKERDAYRKYFNQLNSSESSKKKGNKNRSKTIIYKDISKSKREKNDERGLKFRKAEEKIWTAVKAGELSEDDAKKKLSSIKNKIWPNI